MESRHARKRVTEMIERDYLKKHSSDPVFDAFGEKIATAIQDSTTASHEDLLPSTFKGLARKKESMVHPSQQVPSETMSPAKWKQTLKDVPLSVLAGGVGWGIGHTLAQMIGENIARTGTRPGWTKAIPIATGALSMAGAYAAGRAREGLKQRREEADKVSSNLTPKTTAHLEWRG